MPMFGNSSTGTYNVPTDVYDTAMSQYRSGDIKGAVNTVSNAVGVEPKYLNALVDTESSFNPQAKSDAGALGFTQLMPDTAKSLGVDPTNPIQNLFGGAIYFKAKLEQAGNFIGAYNLYYGLGGKAPVLATDKAAMNRITKVAAQYGITGGESTTSTATPNQNQISIKLADASPYADAMKASQEKSNKILGDISDVIKGAQKPLNEAYSEVEKTYNDYLSKSKEAPTYEDIEKPKNAIQGFFKVALPMLLTLAAFVSPGKYGYRSALAAYTWKALQANDMEKYKLAINDWKDQTAQLKDETQTKLGAIKAKIEMITNNINLTTKEKELELTYAENEYKTAAAGYNAINGMNERLQTGALNYEGKLTTAKATEYAADRNADAKKYAADKAAGSKGDKKNSSSSNNSDNNLSGAEPVTWVMKNGDSYQFKISAKLYNFTTNITARVAADIMRQLKDNPNKPMLEIAHSEGQNLYTAMKYYDPDFANLMNTKAYSERFWNVLNQLADALPGINQTYSSQEAGVQVQKEQKIQEFLENSFLLNVVRYVPLSNTIGDYKIDQIFIDEARGITPDYATDFWVGSQHKGHNNSLLPEGNQTNNTNNSSSGTNNTNFGTTFNQMVDSIMSNPYNTGEY